MNVHIWIAILSAVPAVLLTWGLNAATPGVFVLVFIGLEAVWWVMKPPGKATLVFNVTEMDDD